jgi:hypothetical protein
MADRPRQLRVAEVGEFPPKRRNDQFLADLAQHLPVAIVEAPTKRREQLLAVNGIRRKFDDRLFLLGREEPAVGDARYRACGDRRDRIGRWFRRASPLDPQTDRAFRRVRPRGHSRRAAARRGGDRVGRTCRRWRVANTIPGRQRRASRGARVWRQRVAQLERRAASGGQRLRPMVARQCCHARGERRARRGRRRRPSCHTPPHKEAPLPPSWDPKASRPSARL